MRVWVIAAAVLFAAPVWAQALTDGKASVDEYTGSFVESYVSNLKGPELGESSFRSIVTGIIARKMKPEEKDLFLELASGQPVVVTAPGKVINVPALTGKVLGMAKLAAAPPNLNTLYKARGEPMLQMIEMSQWGDWGKNRVTDFMASKRYAAWQKSDVRNSYTAWVLEFAGINNARSEIADPALKARATQLFKVAVEKVLVMCKTNGREMPNAFSTIFLSPRPISPANRRDVASRVSATTCRVIARVGQRAMFASADFALADWEAVVHQGGCHCGAVRYETASLPERHSVCCCNDCRRTAGAPMVSWAIYPKDAVKVVKGAPKSRASSGHAERFFCGDCGTGLFYISEAYLPGKIDVASATLDEPETIGPPAAVVQTDDRIGWAADIHRLPEFPRYPGMS